MQTNYHTHSRLCDGRGEPEEYVQVAVDRGFAALGFSSHAPLPVANDWTLTQASLPVYLKEIDRLKAAWSGRIQIYKGLEIDYIPESQAPGDTRYDSLGLDYRIGSVHSTTGLERNPRYCCVDGPLEDLVWLLEEVHQGSFEALSEAYYTRLAEMVRGGGFSFVGHLDLLKKSNRDERFFSEEAPWYQRQVHAALDVLAASGLIMELNSGGIARGTIDEIYPSPWILARARRLGIPVMINADAHQPEDVDCCFPRMRAALTEAAYRETWALLAGAWVAVPL